MQSLEKRITALETKASGDTVKIVIVLEGETNTDALERAALPLDALRVVYGSPLDAKL